MAQAQHTLTLASLEEAITVLFCLVDDTYALLNPKWQSHESLKKLSDSEVLTLALFQQLRGCGEREVFLARRPTILCSSVPGRSGYAPLLAPSTCSQAQELS